MLLPRKLGLVTLAVWLVLTGLAGFIDLGDLRKILHLLAIAAGVLILLSR